MLNNQFKKMYTDLANKGLSLSEKAYMTEIYDRMESSQKHDEFFDADIQDYYVIYTVEEMAKTLEIGVSTVKRIIRKLIQKKWIYVKRLKNRVNCIFICNDKKISNIDNANGDNLKKNTEFKMSSVQGSKWSPNQTDNKQTNDILDASQIQATQNNNIQETAETTSSVDTQVALNGLKYNLIHNICLPEEAVNSLFEVSEFKETQVRKYLDMLLYAKRIATKKAHKELYFEKSGEIQGTLAERIKYVFQKAKEVAKNKVSYIRQSFVNYFYEILCPEEIAQPTQSVASTTNVYRKKPRFVEQMPSWIKEQQEQNTPQVDTKTPEKTNNQGSVAEIQRLMAKINSRKEQNVVATV